MSRLFEELDYQPTPIGPVSLRRRRLLHLDRDVVEVMLGEEHLMSSLFTEGERALASLGLAAAQGENLSVVVGGLGLGYTAAAALDDPRVSELLVVEYLAPVIDWHRRGLVPLGERLCGDARCRFVQADFFAAARAAAPAFDPDAPGRRFDAILLDVDHAPDRLLNPTHGDIYTAEGLARLTEALKPITRSLRSCEYGAGISPPMASSSRTLANQQGPENPSLYVSICSETAHMGLSPSRV